jgi:hypothetical protein
MRRGRPATVPADMEALYPTMSGAVLVVVASVTAIPVARDKRGVV